MKKMLVLLVLALLVVGGTCAAAKVGIEEAVGFRNNLAHTGVYETDGVPVFHGLKWKFRTDGVVTSSPTIANGVAYIGSDDTYLYAVNIADGTELWRFKTHGPIKSTPAVFGELVYVSSQDGHLYAIKAKNGKLKWQFEAAKEDQRLDAWDLWQTSPFIYGDQVFFGGWDEQLYALEATTGELVQTYQVGHTHATPAIANGKLFVGTTNHAVSAYDLQTGAKLWTAEEEFSVYASPVYHEGLLYVADRRSGILRALDGETGQVKWKFTTDNYTWIWSQSSPAIANGILYLGTSDDFAFYAVDASSGNLLWQMKMADAVHASPAYARGVVYLAVGDTHGFGDTGTIMAVDGQTGNKLWSYETYGVISSSPVLHDGVLYVGSNDGYLYAIY